MRVSELVAGPIVREQLGGQDRARSPEIVADAAVEVLTRPSRELTGQCLLDVEVLRHAGTTDLTRYGGTGDIEYDIFVDAPGEE